MLYALSSPLPVLAQASPARRSALLMAAEGGAMGSQPSSGGQSPLAAGTPRGSGIVNAGECSLLVVAAQCTLWIVRFDRWQLSLL